MTQRTVVFLSFALFVLALFSGIFTFLVYTGIPYHQYVYMQNAQVQEIDAVCNPNGQVNMAGSAMGISTLLCRGTMATVPFMKAFFAMGSPFLPYVVISFLVFGCLMLWAGFTTGYFRFHFALRPFMLILLFMASVWLIGTTLSLTTLYNRNTPSSAMLQDVDGRKILQSFRTFFEPLPQVYSGAGEQALAELQANYQSLKQRGCLSETGLKLQNGAQVFNLSILCIQESMLVRVGSQLLLVSLFLLALVSLGRFLLLSVLRVRLLDPLLELGLSVGLGALGWVALLWTLGVFGLLNAVLFSSGESGGFSLTITQLLFVGIPLVLYRSTWYWITSLWRRKADVELSFRSWLPILAWLLLSYLALNFLNVVRPFPIGWDDLGSYLNRPRLLASYGFFIPSMSQFQWEYLTSLAYLLFGFDSITGSTFAMQINWSAGLIAVLAVYVFGRTYFGKGTGLLAAMLYYLLPMTGHFSFADMKVDNASFFTTVFMLLAVFMVMLPAFRGEEDDQRSTVDLRLLLVAGLIGGFSFAIKPTGILGILMALSVIVGALLGPLGFSGMALLGFGALMKAGPLSVTGISQRAGLGSGLSPMLVFVLFLTAGAALLGIAIHRRRIVSMTLGKTVAAFLIGTGIAVLPWGIHNIMLTGNVAISSALTAPDLTAPQVSYDLAPTTPPPQTPPTRYLPPDLKLDRNSPACKTSAKTEELDRYWGFREGIGHYLGLPWRQVMNIDTFGYYVTLIPALLLLPLLLLLPVIWTRNGRWLRLLVAGTAVFFVQWMLVANGISWYGIGMFLGFALLLEAFVVYAPDPMNRSLFGTLIALSIMICLVNRFWQFDTQKNLFEYPLGKTTASALREVTIPEYDDVRASVVSRHESLPDTPYTYRIGTFISYFIPRNREIFPLADHQLNFFNCINQERNHALTLRRLKALGFNSIIFDTNTQTIEQNPNGTLHQKVNAFLEFGNDASIGLQVVINDPGNGIAYILLP